MITLQRFSSEYILPVVLKHCSLYRFTISLILLYATPQCSALLPCVSALFHLFLFLHCNFPLLCCPNSSVGFQCSLLPFFFLDRNKKCRASCLLCVEWKSQILGGSTAAAMRCIHHREEKPPASNSCLPASPSYLGRSCGAVSKTAWKCSSPFQMSLMLWYYCLWGFVYFVFLSFGGTFWERFWYYQ